VTQSETVDPMIQPFRHEGEDKFVLLLHTFQAYDIRRSTSSGDWLDIHKNAHVRGGKNPLFKNALGEYAGVILHKHRNVIRFSDYGSGSNLNAARALFLGAQAGMIAWGGAVKGTSAYNWNEETDDRGNRLVITAGSIYGCKKTRYTKGSTNIDYGVMVMDSYYNTAATGS
jgi:N4-gp56 family major capsid protein